MRFRLLILSSLLLFSQAIAQTPEELENLKKTFPGHSKIVLLDETYLKIDIKNDELLVNYSEKTRSFYTDHKAQLYAEDEVSSSSFRHLESIDVFTEIPEGKSFKKHKTKEVTISRMLDNNIYFDDILTHRFVYPNLRENAISNLVCNYSMKEPRLIQGKLLQDYFPINQLSYIIDVDERINMDFVSFNMNGYKLDSTYTHEKGRKIYQFSATGIKALKIEEDMPPARYYMPHIIPIVNSYQLKGKIIPVLRNTDDLFTWNAAMLADTCVPDLELRQKAAEITRGLNREDEKVNALFGWVQKNIHYVAIEVGLGGFIPECAGMVYKNRYGDCKGMANLLHQMLKGIGIKSYLTLIGSNDLPYTYAELPSPITDNHMICTYIDTVGSSIFLDPTNPYIAYGTPSSFIQGKEAFIFKEGNYSIEKVPVMNADFTQQFDSIQLNISGSSLIGKGLVDLSGYYYQRVKSTSSNIHDDIERINFLSSYLKRGNNKFIIKKATEIPENKPYTIQYAYDFEIGNYVQTAGEKLYINLNIFQGLLHEKIKDTHPYPIIFEMQNSLSYVVDLAIPEGYKPDFIPQSISFENEYYALKINYSYKPGHLTYTLYTSYKTMMLKPDQFYLYNEYLQTVKKAYREVVTLQKTI